MGLVISDKVNRIVRCDHVIGGLSGDHETDPGSYLGRFYPRFRIEFRKQSRELGNIPPQVRQDCSSSPWQKVTCGAVGGKKQIKTFSRKS